jgi:hypothetical protein
MKTVQYQYEPKQQECSISSTCRDVDIIGKDKKLKRKMGSNHTKITN